MQRVVDLLTGEEHQGCFWLFWKECGHTLAVSVDMVYAVVELALEDRKLPADAVLQQGARMIRMYWRDILRQREGA